MILQSVSVSLLRCAQRHFIDYSSQLAAFAFSLPFCHLLSLMVQLSQRVSKIKCIQGLVQPVDSNMFDWISVALNYQSEGRVLQLNRAKFSSNGNCGYILKPACMCEGQLIHVDLLGGCFEHNGNVHLYIKNSDIIRDIQVICVLVGTCKCHILFTKAQTFVLTVYNSHILTI